jgi:UDP-N-acetyl-D-glucosamine dehydrogenase
MKTPEEKIGSKECRIVVVGLGYVGLPLALAFVEEGFAVIGLEKDAARIESLRRGESYIDDIPSQRLKAAVDRGFGATLSAAEAYAQADAVFICVPTPLTITKDPDLSFIREAGEAFAPSWNCGAAGEHDLPRYDRGSAVADPRPGGNASGKRFLSGLFSRTGGPRQ